jgi:hypothetical protein
MNRTTLFWTILISVIDILLISYLRDRVIEGNDKSIILFLFYYPLIIIANYILWRVLKRTTLNKPMKIIFIALVVLFLPLWLIMG